MLYGEALADCILLVGTGSTPSSAIINTLFLLLNEPGQKNYAELQRQLDLAFEQGDEPDTTVIAQRAPLLAAVVNETLRYSTLVDRGRLSVIDFCD